MKNESDLKIAENIINSVEIDCAFLPADVELLDFLKQFTHEMKTVTIKYLTKLETFKNHDTELL